MIIRRTIDSLVVFSILSGSLISGLALSGCTTAKKSKEVKEVKEPSFPISWVQVGPDSSIIARTITEEEFCPAIQLDSNFEKMTVRSAPSPEFPIRVCESLIPANTRTAFIHDKPLALPKPELNRILVIGDTGCRVKSGKWGSEIQDCRNPKEWPFEKISSLATEWKPDLVIHVGDYLYRESPCPKEDPKCSNSPIGDRWSTWNADFFSPSQTLLTSSPWVFVRGNHEICARAGQGWFKFLDPRAYPSSCTEITQPYWVKAGHSQFVIMDSALAEDVHPKKDQIDQYLAQFKSMRQFPLTDAWIFTHKPFWGFVEKEYKKENPLTPLNSTLQAAAKNQLSEKIYAMVSGHIHTFESLKFQDKGPVQLVAGNSGTKLTHAPARMDGMEIGDRTVKEGISVKEFGFMTLERMNGDSWKISEHSINGKIALTCTLKKSTYTCK